ncbi:hypothetical protein BBK82_13750 [Lentzea guizhouensis]|uniref:Glycosyltransferase 2-like domain-containing protein n=1 Tax=Lentzea guizhouensis TaxID=1586287 RepID=A0A1B2HGX4_9PSEU|nr:glycosyltransferase family 2 protein [Lentzea guizhouensis]ANZ36977.1 hypothetical protein BBK82_13750 [Lentzea guizhouensis]
MNIHFLAPYYLEPKILFELIDSMIAQTRGDWILTVVDDQYPGTAAEDYIKEIGDPRIEYVRNEVNLGATANVTKCMELGRGTYLVVMGADDALEPNYVETVLGMFERHPNAIMAHPGVVVIDENSKPHDPLPLADRVKIFAGRNAWKHRELDGPEALASLMNGNWLYVPAMAFRQDVVQGTKIRQDFGSIGDLGWVTELLLKGGTLALDPTPAFRYRRHMASHSSNHAKDVVRFDEEKYFYLDAAKRLEAKGWTKAARAARLHVFSRLHAMQSALDALKGGDVKRTMALAKRGLS